MRRLLLQTLFGLLLARSAWALRDDPLPTSLSQDPREERQDEFGLNIDLLILESRTLKTGEHRSAFWPLFHLTTEPQGAVHSWSVLNFFKGPDYTLFLPLFYSIGDDFGILPPLLLGGADYWASAPLLSGRWSYEDGDRTTWVTPLFHLTRSADGPIRNLHAGPYLQGDTWWALPPLLSAGWQRPQGGDAFWLTPLLHRTTDVKGNLESFHALTFFQGPDYWILLPLAGSGTGEDGTTTTGITPLFWLVSDQEGLESMSFFPLFHGSRDTWCAFPLLSGGRTRTDHATTMWLTPLLHVDRDPLGELKSYHVGPFFAGQDYWAVPPLLSWHVRYDNGVAATWLTPLFHRTTDKEGLAESAHLLPAFFWKREDYWVVPPLLSSGWKSGNGDQNLWVTPFFHWTSTHDGTFVDMHLGPYMQGQDYWAVPPLLSCGWERPGGGGTTWLTPLFHVTTNDQGDLESLHAGPYFQGRDGWIVPPALSWHHRFSDRRESTWLTPAFHLNVDPEGEATSAHLLPAFVWERDDYLILPALLSGCWREKDAGRTTWATPLVHVTQTREETIESLHAAPLFFWKRDAYWVVPPLLSGGGTHPDGSRTSWFTPLAHRTEDKAGDAESFHAFPLFFWKRDDYWAAPLLLTGGFMRPDGTRRTWVTPFYHDDVAPDGTLRSRHLLTYFDGPTYRHLVPLFWDWKDAEATQRTMVAPPLYVRTEEVTGDVTTSLPWPLVTLRRGSALDTSIGMELRPFLYQSTGRESEFNFLWRVVSVLEEEQSTRVRIGPLWRSEQPAKADAMMSFQILGGLFARDCNYETDRYRYRILWIIPLGAEPMHP